MPRTTSPIVMVDSDRVFQNFGTIGRGNIGSASIRSEASTNHVIGRWSRYIRRSGEPNGFGMPNTKSMWPIFDRRLVLFRLVSEHCIHTHLSVYLRDFPKIDFLTAWGRKFLGNIDKEAVIRCGELVRLRRQRMQLGRKTIFHFSAHTSPVTPPIQRFSRRIWLNGINSY